MNDLADDIKAAEAEAKRFLERVAEWRKAQRPKTYALGTYTPATPRESGAMKRASLDLTRALAKMRRRR